MKALNNKKIVIIIVIILIIVLFVAYYVFIYRQKNDNDDVVEINSELSFEKVSESSKNDIYVDIKGLVNKPGVYSFSLNDNARINDLIIKAGGLLKEADTSIINLSKKLEDEMTIIIYSKNEIANYLKTQNDLIKKLEICEAKLKNNACIKIQENKTMANKINLNEASLEELMSLNGIGEAKAKAIIEYREKEKFKSIEDIKNVEGIGENLFTAIKENITI